jgi:hypothetical protein
MSTLMKNAPDCQRALPGVQRQSGLVEKLILTRACGHAVRASRLLVDGGVAFANDRVLHRSTMLNLRAELPIAAETLGHIPMIDEPRGGAAENSRVGDPLLRVTQFSMSQSASIFVVR